MNDLGDLEGDKALLMEICNWAIKNAEIDLIKLAMSKKRNIEET